jgi:hypothetical protein
MIRSHHLALCVVVAGCMAVAPRTPEERAYVAKVNIVPLEFVIPASQSELAWGRAQSWIGRFSSMKLQTVSDYNIQINVQCSTGNMFAVDAVDRNARILALCISSGEMPPDTRLIAR